MEITIAVYIAAQKTYKNHIRTNEEIFINTPYYYSILKNDRGVTESKYNLCWEDWVNYDYYTLIVTFIGENMMKDIIDCIEYINTLRDCRILSYNSEIEVCGGYKKVELWGFGELPLNKVNLLCVAELLST